MTGTATARITAHQGGEIVLAALAAAGRHDRLRQGASLAARIVAVAAGPVAAQTAPAAGAAPDGEIVVTGTRRR